MECHRILARPASARRTVSSSGASKTSPAGMIARAKATRVWSSAGENLLGRVGGELQDLAACSDGATDLEEKAMLGFVEVRAPEKEVVAIRAKLEALLKELQKPADRKHDEKGLQRYRLMFGYYPLVKPPTAD